MIQKIQAIYENGILRPIVPIKGIPENARVWLLVEEEKSTHNLLKHCGTVPDVDTREILQIIDCEFKQVSPDDRT